MSTNNETLNREKSSKKVAEFLEKNRIHKKDFAQMIGVTLSYIYNLIDENIQFPSRSTTLERIAVVMDILPEEFDEYIIREDGILYNKNIEKIKNQMKKTGIKTIDFLKQFERKRRLSLVDILRGAKKIPADFFELEDILKKINMKDEEIFEIWQNVIADSLDSFGFNSNKNQELLSSMLSCAKEKIYKKP